MDLQMGMEKNVKLEIEASVLQNVNHTLCTCYFVQLTTTININNITGCGLLINVCQMFPVSTTEWKLAVLSLMSLQKKQTPPAIVPKVLNNTAVLYY